MFDQLESFNARPEVFGVYTAEDLWTDPHISEKMLSYHLDGDVAMASRTSEFIGRSLTWLASYAEIGRGTAVLDLGCGPGLYSNPIAALGAQVVGIDFSARSLRHARLAKPTKDTSPTYIDGNYLDVDIPGSFDLILLAMCDYCALSPTQRYTLLNRVRSLLRANGRFIFDVYGLASMRDREETVNYEPRLMDGFWSADPYHGFIRTFRYERARVTLDKYEIVEAHRSRSIYNWLQYFDPASVAEELEACNLAISEHFGDLTGANFTPDSSQFCIVAQRS